MGLLSTIGAASGRAFGLTRVGAAIRDAYFNLTTLLLPGNGTNGAQNNTFLDSSSNNFTITRNGNTTQGTFSPFSQTGWSNYFGGSQSINAAASADFQLTGDFTIEGWIYTTSTSDASLTVQQSGSNYFAFNVQGGTGFNIYLNSTSATISPTDRVPAVNTWNHVALVRSGTGSGNVKIYLNGVASSTTATNTSTLGYNALFYVGAIGTNSSGSFVGYISNVRVVNGTALYTNNFTPSTTPLTDVANTKLLTCQSNRFIDTNTQVTAKTITVNGTPSVQAFEPFAPTAAYSAATVGGSGYFDGSGDYLSIANNTALQLSTGVSWCLEAWIYPTALVNADNGIIGKRTTASVEWQFAVKGTGDAAARELYLYNGSGNYFSGTKISGVNAWTHVAVSWDQTTLRFFINGTLCATTHTSISLPAASTNSVGVGANGNVETFTGYITDARIVKGSAVYTASFTPPTAPLTAITNTSLLTNFTNAGITDATAKNVLETVGNAQISTTQSKFGGSSMYFDGTGDYLFSPSSQNFAFPGDFTIEFWSYITAISGEGNTFYVTTTGGINIFLNISSNWGIARSGTAVDNNFGTPPAQNTWNHIAVSRSGSTINAYINGTRVFTGTNTSNYVAGPLQFGLSAFGSITGYIDDLRVTKFARYTGSTLTVPTAAFPLQ